MPVVSREELSTRIDGEPLKQRLQFRPQALRAFRDAAGSA
jgi:hypothetical protein